VLVADRNEADVGAAVRESGVPREEIWITTKLWTDEFGLEKSKVGAEGCLSRLGLDYVDMLLFHACVHAWVLASRWRSKQTCECK